MGITGLLPFLEKGKVSRPANIKEFKGSTVAADAYCWLHKGAFACADKLARGEQTDMFVQYCMKYVNMLLANDIKPILVFDGRHLPAKAQTEKKRREKREENRKQAANLLRQGQTAEALSFLRRCIDVTHKMALMLMQECRRRNVDCIVAPYEADAQLAHFSLEGIADLVVTEDSDLLLFGCKRVMFKLDLSGNGVLVDQERLYLSMGTRPEAYSFDKFRYMCILSGCDYLESLPGIGLGKACKFIVRTQDPDIHKALSRLPSQLNIRGLTVPVEYRDEFIKANAMFKHQLVFDPISRKPRPLTPHQSVHPESPMADGPLPGCVPEFDMEMSFQLAVGNLDPFKLEKVDDFDPSLPRNECSGVKTQGWNQNSVAPHPSIWDPQFLEKMAKPKPRVTPSFMPTNKAKMRAVDTDELLNMNGKRGLDEDNDLIVMKRPSLDQTDVLTSKYASPVSMSTSDVSLSPLQESPKFSPVSPAVSGKRSSRNPFVRSSTNSCNEDVEKEISSSPNTTKKQVSKFSALNKFARATQRTSTEGKPIVQSRYFGNCNEGDDSDIKDSSSSLLRDVSNTVDGNIEVDSRVIQIYRKDSEKEDKGPMIHKKPLFASSSNMSQDQFEMEFENHPKSCLFSKDKDIKSLCDQFKKSPGPELKTSPSKNPFKKNFTTDAQEGHRITNTCSNFKNLVADDDEDVDDPGFESSCSLTPCSPGNVLSQPDDGFESPSKTPSGKKMPLVSVESKVLTIKQSKPSCRTPGLKRPPTAAPAQSKLSAFGFVPKPKIQRS